MSRFLLQTITNTDGEETNMNVLKITMLVTGSVCYVHTQWVAWLVADSNHLPLAAVGLSPCRAVNSWGSYQTGL